MFVFKKFSQGNGGGLGGGIIDMPRWRISDASFEKLSILIQVIVHLIYANTIAKEVQLKLLVLYTAAYEEDIGSKESNSDNNYKLDSLTTRFPLTVTVILMLLRGVSREIERNSNEDTTVLTPAIKRKLVETMKNLLLDGEGFAS